jgi:hypothetical protein
MFLTAGRARIAPWIAGKPPRPPWAGIRVRRAAVAATPRPTGRQCPLARGPGPPTRRAAARPAGSSAGAAAGTGCLDLEVIVRTLHSLYAGATVIETKGTFPWSCSPRRRCRDIGFAPGDIRRCETALSLPTTAWQHAAPEPSRVRGPPRPQTLPHHPGAGGARGIAAWLRARGSKSWPVMVLLEFLRRKLAARPGRRTWAAACSEFPPIELDRVHVLLAAKHQTPLLFALGCCSFQTGISTPRALS